MFTNMFTEIAIAVVVLVAIGAGVYFWRRAEVVPLEEAAKIFGDLEKVADKIVSHHQTPVVQTASQPPDPPQQPPSPPTTPPASQPAGMPEEEQYYDLSDPRKRRWFTTILLVIVISVITATFLWNTGLNGVYMIAELAVFCILMTSMGLTIAWKNGYFDTWFFEIEDGCVAFVDSGRSNVFVYINDPGYILRWGVKVDGVEINDWVRISEQYPGQSEEEKTFIQRKWGKYWRGPDLLNRKVHMIPLTKKKAATSLRKNMPLEEWITGTDDVVMVDQLRTVFPRPVAVPDLKFADGFEADLLLNGNFEVVVPRRLVYSLKGDFFGTLESYTRTGMKDIASAGLMTSTTFRTSSQIEGSQMSNDIVIAINITLVAVCGVRSKGFSIPIYNLSSDREEAAAKAAAIEELEGKGRIAKAIADAEVARIAAVQAAANKITDARAEAEADNLRNAASITDITIATEVLVGMGVDPNVAAMQATIVGKATRHSDRYSPVTTLVEGGNSPIAINPKPSNANKTQDGDAQAE